MRTTIILIFLFLLKGFASEAQSFKKVNWKQVNLNFEVPNSLRLDTASNLALSYSDDKFMVILINMEEQFMSEKEAVEAFEEELGDAGYYVFFEPSLHKNGATRIFYTSFEEERNHFFLMLLDGNGNAFLGSISFPGGGGEKALKIIKSFKFK